MTQHTMEKLHLKIMLPKVNGFEILEYIEPLKIPVIFLTAKNSVEDKVKGLRMGAEDYIVKPFEPTELLARIDVVLRRYKKTEEVITIGGLTINQVSMQVTRDNKEILLTPKFYFYLYITQMWLCIEKQFMSVCGVRNLNTEPKQLTCTYSVLEKRLAGKKY